VAKLSGREFTGNKIVVLAGVIGCFAIIVFVISGDAVSGNWRWDDPSILLHAYQYSIFQDFVNPSVWQQFSPANLTPWLIFSYELDLILFGLSPGIFYVHQLLALLAAVVMLYLVLKLWVSELSAASGAALFLLGAPGITVAQQLMTRHYLEGLVFCLLALFLFVCHLRSNRRLVLVAAVLCYLLSVTAKETYVPLVLLLPFLPEGSLMKRIKASLPFLIVVGLYTCWRIYMLGTATGGYVESSEYISFSFMSQVLVGFAPLPALLFGSPWPVVMSLYGVMLLSYILVYRSLASVAVSLFLLVLLLTLLPLIPLISSPGIYLADRYLLLPWLVMCFSVAFFGDRLIQVLRAGNRQWGICGIGVGITVLLLITASAGLSVKKTVVAVANEYDVQADYILNNDSSTAFVPSPNVVSAMWFVTDLAELKRSLLAQTSPQAIFDELYRLDDMASLVGYNADCQCMRVTSLPVIEKRDLAPLSLQFNYQSRTFSWQFGPYDNGTYRVVSPNFGVMPVPATGRIRVTLGQGDVFYLRYDSPEGWITYSDQQTIESSVHNVRWQRE